MSRRDTTPSVTPREEPIVLTLTDALTRSSVSRLRNVVRGVSGQRPIIIDVTTIPRFDSDGTADLLALQEEVGAHRLVVAGMRQAAARVLGIAEIPVNDSLPFGVVSSESVQVTPGLVMIEARPDWSVATLQSTLRVAVDKHIAIVIVDMTAVSEVTAEMVEAIEATSLTVAGQGQELVLANLTEAAALTLRRAQLSATTYLTSRH